jgi:M6 family metalloprotease-like protein
MVGGETLDVHFDGSVPDGLTCGSVLHVSGMRVNHRVAPVSSHVRGVETAKLTAQASTPCTPTGTQSIAVILVTFPGVALPIDTASLQTVFFGAGNRSLAGYWQDASYGRATATGAVFGPYTLSQAYTCDQYSAMGAEALKLADPDVNFTQYNRIFYVFPLPSGCSYGGLSTVGCVTQSSADGTFTASNHWIVGNYLNPNDQGVELIAHEGGHGLGLNHARSRGFAPIALGALGANGTITEYGDNFDTMGYYNLGHYAAQHKSQLGWISPSNILNVQGSGTYSVAPMGTSTSGPLALQVQRGTGNPDYLWVEYHQPVGNYENALSSQIYSGATIRYQDSLTGYGYTNLLDFTPTDGSWMDPALAAGQSWTDPYSNVSLTVSAATSSALTVGVNYGTIPCTHGTPTMTATPSNPSVTPGSTVNYSVAITNNDTSTCGSSSFSVSSGSPSGWNTSMSASTVNLAPGQTAAVTVSKTVPTGVAPGTYAVPFGAADSTMSASTNANCSVTAPAPPLSATLSLPASTYRAKSTIPLTASVLSGSSAAAGASVTFTISATKGGASQTLTTNSSGIATWNYRANSSGAYSVTAKVTLGSQTVTTNTVSFTVQ